MWFSCTEMLWLGPSCHICTEAELYTCTLTVHFWASASSQFYQVKLFQHCSWKCLLSEIEWDHRRHLESVTEEIDKATPEEKRTVEKQDKKEQKEVNDLQEWPTRKNWKSSSDSGSHSLERKVPIRRMIQMMLRKSSWIKLTYKNRLEKILLVQKLTVWKWKVPGEVEEGFVNKKCEKILTQKLQCRIRRMANFENLEFLFSPKSLCI